MGKRDLEQVEKEQERLFSNYTMLRNGIKDHIQVGQFSDRELGVYSFLNLYSSWEYKLSWTNAAAVATTFAHPGVNLRSVQNSFLSLREKKYIDYPVGGLGKGISYPVLIVKAEPTHGVLKGSRLIGFVPNDFESVLYEFPCASRAQAVLKQWVGVYLDRAHDVRCACATCAQPVLVRVSLKEVKMKRKPTYEKVERIQEGEEGNPPPDPLESSAVGHGD
jgi:hypothetical protein